jgi:hypothetical protein
MNAPSAIRIVLILSVVAFCLWLELFAVSVLNAF